MNAQLAETGRALVGVDGGFSCVACHGVKNRDPLQVFEAQGVNFSRVDERLHSEYFLRWMLDPLGWIRRRACPIILMTMPAVC